MPPSSSTDSGETTNHPNPTQRLGNTEKPDDSPSPEPMHNPRLVPGRSCESVATDDPTRPRTFPTLGFDAVQRANFQHHQLNSFNAPSFAQSSRRPSTSGLQISTDLPTPPIVEHCVVGEEPMRRSLSNTSLSRRARSHRPTMFPGKGARSPGSTMSSPQLSAMADMTPLPSPIGGGGKDPWKLAVRTRSRASSAGSNRESLSSNATAATTIQSSPPRRKPYNGLRVESISPVSSVSSRDTSQQYRSISEYVPAVLASPKPRAIAVSGSLKPREPSPPSTLHREEYLAEQRGLSATTPKDMYFEGVQGDRVVFNSDEPEPAAKRQKTDVYEATSIATGLPRKYISIKLLGQGTFSKVYLAVQQVDSTDDGVDYYSEGTDIEGIKKRARRLVAVKIIEHGPAGGADEERMGVSLEREIEILKSIHHPSVVHLRAFGLEEQRALLVLNFCPGGDLFELASSQLHLLVPTLVQRIFAELVSAVRYLHQNYIVHRDIKLENVLLNIPPVFLPEVSDWQRHDRAIVTLTDLGLSRRIPNPPESPMLTTRCGSEDYAAPEILMGQPYDGRQTDAWALGVVLYALMEGRLPFDPLPGTRGDPATLRARTPHRIARCEWAWYTLGDEDGDWDAEKGRLFDGAQNCVDALLKRNTRRKGLDDIAQMPWVKDGILVQGGLVREEEAR